MTSRLVGELGGDLDLYCGLEKEFGARGLTCDRGGGERLGPKLGD